MEDHVRAVWEQVETVRRFFLAGEGNDREKKAQYEQLAALAGDGALQGCTVRDAPSEAAYWWLATARQVAFEAFLSRFSVPVTVSLTTWPARIQAVANTLDSMERQTWKPERTLLWLAEEQFPGKEQDLPEALRAKENGAGLEIRWCDDLKPHKKYFYALQEIREGVVITVDDDLSYPEDTVELLMLSYIRHPEAVSAGRVNLITMEKDGTFLPYRYWIKETDALVDVPCMQLLAVGVGGVLYDPARMPSALFDRETIRNTCLLADDLWLKCHEVMAGIPVTLACQARELTMTEGSQESSLWAQNRASNDIQLQRIIETLATLENGETFTDLMQECAGEDQRGLEGYSRHASHQINRKNETIRKIRLENAREIRQIRGEAREEANRLKEAIAEKNEAIRADQEEIHRAKAAIVEKNEALRANQEEIHQAKEAIAEKNEAIRANQEEIHRLKEAIAEKNEAIRADQEEIHRAKAAIAEKNEALKELRDQKKASEDQLKEKIAHNTETIKQLNADIEALKNSRSYRLGQTLLRPFRGFRN